MRIEYGYDPLTALKNHRKKLVKKQREIEKLWHNIDQSMNELKGGKAVDATNAKD